MSRRLAVLMAALAGGCSFIVAGEDSPVACSDDGYRGPPACDMGQFCSAGVCQPVREIDGARGGSPAVGDGGGASSGGEGAEAAAK